MARQLLEAILDNGVSNPNYFDGRLLTASALRADQDAQRARQRQLGQALGPGVVDGLWVTIDFAGTTSSPPLLGVGAGLAMNGHGQTLRLPAREVVALAPVTSPPPTGAGLFKTCEPPSATVDAPADGFYLLVLSPASAYSGRAPISGLAVPSAGAGCGSDAAIEGVRLRSVALDPLAVTGVSTATRQQITTLRAATSDADLSKLRNLVAHVCLGTEPLATFPVDPFALRITDDGGTEPALADYGALDALVDADSLTDCDVPLALYYWRGNALLFADNWSVRRRLAPPATADAWPTLSGGRRRAEAEAALFQFQEQVTALVIGASNPTALRALDCFAWLPPTGIVPLAGGGRRGFSDAAFFDGMKVSRAADSTLNPIYVDGARVGELVSASFAHLPIAAGPDEFMWLYRVRQNDLLPAESGTEYPYAMFASGHLPYVGTARFDLARWDRSNFGLL